MMQFQASQWGHFDGSFHVCVWTFFVAVLRARAKPIRHASHGAHCAWRTHACCRAARAHAAPERARPFDLTQRANQPTMTKTKERNQPRNQPTNQPTKLPANQPASQPASQPSKQGTSDLVHARWLLGLGVLNGCSVSHFWFCRSHDLKARHSAQQ